VANALKMSLLQAQTYLLCTNGYLIWFKNRE